ncbi:MAG: hypothetical protein O7H41_21120 [Planctomycetota bacterium]|nr:hypothetical protein [Planctomycetota bacterium]
MKTSSALWTALLVLTAVIAFSYGCKKDKEKKPPALSTIRLFIADDFNQWIQELNPHTGFLRNFYPVPTPISVSGTALAYNSEGKILYLIDPSDQWTIWRILPDQSSPGGVDALALPQPAYFSYESLGYDGEWLLALDPTQGQEIIDALDPGTGALQYSTSFCRDPLDPTNCYDLSGGMDAGLREGIYTAGVDRVTGEARIYHVDSTGAILDTFSFAPGFDPQGIAVARNFLFVADVSTSKIKIYKIVKRKGRIELDFLDKDIDFPTGATVTALAAGR